MITKEMFEKEYKPDRNELYLCYNDLGNLESEVDFSKYPNINRLNVSSCNLTSLKGCPDTIRTLRVANNKLKTLEGCSNSVEFLDCRFNKKISFKGVSNKLKYINCSSCMSYDFSELPPTIEHIDIESGTLGFSANQLKLPEYINGSLVVGHLFQQGFRSNSLLLDGNEVIIDRRYLYDSMTNSIYLKSDNELFMENL